MGVTVTQSGSITEADLTKLIFTPASEGTYFLQVQYTSAFLESSFQVTDADIENADSIKSLAVGLVNAALA